MFADDVLLCAEMAAKHGPCEPPFIEAGGIESPCVAQYRITIDAMTMLREHVMTEAQRAGSVDLGPQIQADVRKAQMARYLSIHRPLEATFPGYVCEDPSAGGCDLRGLSDKYTRKDDLGWDVGTIGTLILLSVLEHVDEPWHAPRDLANAMKPGGLLIVSVPWIFPWHPSPSDHWRFSPTGLRRLFSAPECGGDAFEILECDWRLDVPYEAGVIDVKTGRGQAIQSCYLVARKRG